jgi:hypothetical protein
MFVEQHWRSVKYQEFSLRAYDIVAEAVPRSVSIWSFSTINALAGTA